MKKVKLGEVCEILSGYAFKSSQFNDKKIGLPLIRIRDVERGFSDTYFEGAYPEEYLIKNGDLLITMDGSFILKKWEGDLALLNQRVCKIKITDKSVDEGYIAWMIPKFLKEIEDKTPFVTVKHLSVAKIKDISFVLPNKLEQKLISKKLNTISQIYDFRKIQSEELNELVKSRFNEMFGSKKFDKVSISELVDDRIETAKKKFDQHDTIKYIDISSIDNKNYKMTGFQEYMLNQAPSRAQQHIRKGDIVVSTVRPNLKNIAITELDDENLVASSGFCVLRALKCLPEYLFAIICSDRFTNKMTNIVTGANYPAIKSSDIMNYIVPLPPIQLQNEFADYVAKVDKSQLAIQKSLEELETLKKSLMQDYFG